MPDTVYRIGDRVRVLGDAESCCAAEDAGKLGEIVKIKNKNHLIVKSQAGEWAHCTKCIELFSTSTSDFES